MDGQFGSGVKNLLKQESNLNFSDGTVKDPRWDRGKHTSCHKRKEGATHLQGYPSQTALSKMVSFGTKNTYITYLSFLLCSFLLLKFPSHWEICSFNGEFQNPICLFLRSEEKSSLFKHPEFKKKEAEEEEVDSLSLLLLWFLVWWITLIKYPKSCHNFA